MIDPRTPTQAPLRDGRRQGGAALVIVVLTTLVVSALLGAMLIESNTENLIAGNERDAARALEVSKAGLNYAYYLYETGGLTPTAGGAAFTAGATGTTVRDSLDGGNFTGAFFDDSAVSGSGQRYRIQSTGTYRNATRTTELSFLLVSDALTFGYAGFNEVTLHHHAKVLSTFDVQSTIFSNNLVSIDPSLNVNGSVVGSGSVTLDGTDTTVQGDVFSYTVTNAGSIKGRVGLVASVNPTSGIPNVVDNEGTKYLWYAGRSNPAAKVLGSGTIVGGQSRYVVKNGDVFDHDIFAPDGSLILNPPLNVIQYIAPPRIDYKAMKTEADLREATYFTTPKAALDYFVSKKVTETVGGKSMVTMKVGTAAAPEFIYVVGALNITLTPGTADNTSKGTINANGLHIEGGIYASGGFDWNGNVFTSPNTNPAGYHQLKINAIPYCYPALIGYEQPTTGTVASWTPASTPAMLGKGVDIKMQSAGSEGSGTYEGTIFISGLTYSAGETHIHHTNADKELVTLRGAELAWKIHNCDFFNFQYDSAVACTRFLGMQGGGTPGVLSFREIR